MSALPKPRAGQVEFERGVDLHRIAAFLGRRQYGKTTLAARLSLKKMMRIPGHTVVFGSVKVDLGRDIVRKEAEALRRAIALLTAGKSKLLELVDGRNGKSVAGVSADDFAELYEGTRLEFRLWHDKTVYSRTKVVALNESSVGETGDLILDEVGRVKNFRGVWEAVSPIIASNPAFRCILTTTPPPDDGHFSYELLAPPVGTEFPVSPCGNWYRSELGIWVLRVDAWDAAADGVPLYNDDDGAVITPEESRRAAWDKDGWDRNYGVKFIMGGTSAVPLLYLASAQTRGAQAPECLYMRIENDADCAQAAAWLRGHLGDGRLGAGFDVATSEREAANPSAFALVEAQGVNWAARFVATWKTSDSRESRRWMRLLIQQAALRPCLRRVERLALDSSNERMFAGDTKREFAGLVPVLTIAGNDPATEMVDEPMNMKTLMGKKLVDEIVDNRCALPPQRYIHDDFRRVKNYRGSFTTELGPNGEHGDTFDAVKLALQAIHVKGAAPAAAAIHIDRAQALGGLTPSSGDRPRRRGTPLV